MRIYNVNVLMQITIYVSTLLKIYGWEQLNYIHLNFKRSVRNHSPLVWCKAMKKEDFKKDSTSE